MCPCRSWCWPSCPVHPLWVALRSYFAQNPPSSSSAVPVSSHPHWAQSIAVLAALWLGLGLCLPVLLVSCLAVAGDACCAPAGPFLVNLGPLWLGWSHALVWSLFVWRCGPLFLAVPPLQIFLFGQRALSLPSFLNPLVLPWRELHPCRASICLDWTS